MPDHQSLSFPAFPARQAMYGLLLKLTCPAFSKSGFILGPHGLKEGIVGLRGYLAEFRCKVLGLVHAGHSFADVVSHPSKCSLS